MDRLSNDFVKLEWNWSDRKFLELWTNFLERAYVGISMNIITFRRPTRIVISDACLNGIGGFSIKTGKVWRLQIRDDHGMHITIVEWLAAVVTIWLEIYSSDVEGYGNILALTYNTGCVGWLHKNNLSADSQPVEAEIAYKVADIAWHQTPPFTPNTVRERRRW